MNNLAIIPARSGSKGLKDKNIKLLDGKPLIAYTIEEAIKSKQFDEIIVSTDSEEYADISKSWGARVPFLREKELSADNSSPWDMVNNVLQKYEKMGKVYDTITLLQPTSPLRTSKDIIGAFETMKKKEAKSVVAVCEVEHSPLLTNTLPNDHSLENFFASNSSFYTRRRQEMPSYYRINGAIYIVATKFLNDSNFIYDKNSFAYIMKKENSIDIDNSLDFKIAEVILKERY